MKLTWLGHSCWKIEDAGYSVVLDPFAPGSVPGYQDVNTQADAVLCSHDHGDHNYKQGVKIVDSGARPFDIKTIPSWHDDAQGSLRGYNIIHVIDSEVFRVVHLGDLGVMLSDDQIKQIGSADILMIPVGGYFTIDAPAAKKVADSLNARVILPMHYRSDKFGYDVIGTVDEFTKLYPQSMVRKYNENTLEVDEQTPAQVAVLKI